MALNEKKADERLFKIYRIKPGWYKKQLKKQNGGCWICGRPEKNQRLNVDHNHSCCKKATLKKPTCGKCNRGLLCMICNRKVLGMIEKYKIPAQKIVDYLKEFDGI